MAGWPKLNARSCPALLGGGRPASTPWPPGAAITSARSSVPRGAWTRRSRRTGRPWRPLYRLADPPRRPRPRDVGLAEVAYQRTSSTPRCGMPARASGCAASSPTLRRWPSAWRRWRGSGRPAVIRPGPWRRSARRGRPRSARPAAQPGCGAACQAAAGPGNLTEAARWTKECWLDAGSTSRATPRAWAPALARVCWPRGEAEAALALLGRLHAAAAAQDRAGSLIEIGALRALALAARGEERAAVDDLAKALAIACPEGHVRCSPTRAR